MKILNSPCWGRLQPPASRSKYYHETQFKVRITQRRRDREGKSARERLRDLIGFVGEFVKRKMKILKLALAIALASGLAAILIYITGLSNFSTCIHFSLSLSSCVCLYMYAYTSIYVYFYMFLYRMKNYEWYVCRFNITSFWQGFGSVTVSTE